MWDELWIERDVGPRELAIAIAKAHGLAADDIVVIDGIAADPPRQASVEVHRTRGGGEFAMRIQLAGTEPADRRVFCARLASALTCKVLGDDGHVNPCTFMLYEPGNALRVAVDPDRMEELAPVIVGPYDEDASADDHPTRPIRRPESASHRAVSRGDQVSGIVNGYMKEGLPRPPLLEWSAEATHAYDKLHRLLCQLASRGASDDELASVRTWSQRLRREFRDLEKAGWFVVELLEAADIVLAAPWDPALPPVDTQPT
jgi:hypothetical protein